jgi:uncharacterized protein YeaO (DUF488 family)
LDQNTDALQPIKQAARSGDVTLVYAARDTERNSAMVLRDYLEKKRSPKRPRTRAA